MMPGGDEGMPANGANNMMVPDYGAPAQAKPAFDVSGYSSKKKVKAPVTSTTPKQDVNGTYNPFKS